MAVAEWEELEKLSLIFCFIREDEISLKWVETKEGT